MIATVRKLLSLVKFSHSIFALPFALMGAWLAGRGLPEGRVLLLVVVACVAARTAAMGFNRLIDRDVDAANPRTSGRELVTGALRPGSVSLLIQVSAAVFVIAAFELGPLCGWLSFPVLLVLLGYSYAKRVTPLAHLVLGLALGLAPLGAWLAVRGSLAGDVLPPLVLAASVLLWVAGFDLIYACQDADYDREAGLHSIPARFGEASALRMSKWMHLATVGLWVVLGMRAELGWIYWMALAGAALLLAWEHRLVRPNDLTQVDMAFFTINGWVGVALFVGVALDLWLVSGQGVA